MTDPHDSRAEGQPHPAPDLLRRWQESGDLDALDALLRTEVAILKDFVSRRGHDILSSSASASDVAQEAVLRLLRLESPPRFESPKALRSYLWTTAWRLLVDRVRAPYRPPRSLDSVDSEQLADSITGGAALSALDDVEAASAVNIAMTLLPDEDRDVLHRAYFEGESVSDISAAIGSSESAVKMRLLRARRRLAERLTAWSETIG